MKEILKKKHNKTRKKDKNRHEGNKGAAEATD